MKTLRFFSMAVLAIMMAACSDEIQTISEQPAAQQKIPFSATIGAPGSGTTTRTTLTPGKDANDKDILNVAWKEGDAIALIHGGNKDVVTVQTVNADGSATISGDITVGSDDEDVTVAYPAAAVTPDGGGAGYKIDDSFAMKSTIQEGTLDYIADNLDLRVGDGKLSVSVNPAKATLKENVTLENQKVAIWKLTLTKDGTPLNAVSVNIWKGTKTVASYSSSEGKSEVYLCVDVNELTSAEGVFHIRANDGTNEYFYAKPSGVTLEADKFYQSTVKLEKHIGYLVFQEITQSTTDLEIPAKDGNNDRTTVLYGTGSTNAHVTVADGANVVLCGVDIPTSADHNWAGITCLGDATITLMGTNKLGRNAGWIYYPGLQAPGTGKTLTIKGSGKLEAISTAGAAIGAVGTNGATEIGNIIIEGGEITATSIHAAGIGGTQKADCGNITIRGGKITASITNNAAAAIGGGKYRNCGNIEISGGTVVATGKSGGAGIGGGEDGVCGTITISGGDITATGGADAPGIGAGATGNDNSTCGAISITGGTIRATAGVTDEDSKGATTAIGIGGKPFYWETGKTSTCTSVTIGTGITTLITNNTNTTPIATTGKVGDFINATTVSICGESVTDLTVSAESIYRSGFVSFLSSDKYQWTIGPK